MTDTDTSKGRTFTFPGAVTSITVFDDHVVGEDRGKGVFHVLVTDEESFYAKQERRREAGEVQEPALVAATSHPLHPYHDRGLDADKVLHRDTLAAEADEQVTVDTRTDDDLTVRDMVDAAEDEQGVESNERKQRRTK